MVHPAIETAFSWFMSPSCLLASYSTPYTTSISPLRTANRCLHRLKYPLFLKYTCEWVAGFWRVVLLWRRAEVSSFKLKRKCVRRFWETSPLILAGSLLRRISPTFFGTCHRHQDHQHYHLDHHHDRDMIIIISIHLKKRSRMYLLRYFGGGRMWHFRSTHAHFEHEHTSGAVSHKRPYHEEIREHVSARENAFEISSCFNIKVAS